MANPSFDECIAKGFISRQGYWKPWLMPSCALRLKSPSCKIGQYHPSMLQDPTLTKHHLRIFLLLAIMERPVGCKPIDLK